MSNNEIMQENQQNNNDLQEDIGEIKDQLNQLAHDLGQYLGLEKQQKQQQEEQQTPYNKLKQLSSQGQVTEFNHTKNEKSNSNLQKSNSNLEKSNSNLQNLLKRLKYQLEQQKSMKKSKLKQVQLVQKIQQIELKQRLTIKMEDEKSIISIQRLNHLQQIFKHYCTHIFKTGKHMTFQRLQYQKVHLTLDRLLIFLKDFNLTITKLQDHSKDIQIVDKQEIIKLFKKISTNTRDLSFQNFVLIIDKLGQVYYDSKVNYWRRKQHQNHQRIKNKQDIQKRAKYKLRMIQNHNKKISQMNQQLNESKIKNSGQNDTLLDEIINNIQQSQNQNQQVQNEQIRQRTSSNTNINTKKQRVQTKKNKSQINQFESILTRQQKIQYFYELINIDNVNSFRNKLRQLNLPLFQMHTTNLLKQKIKKINQTTVDQGFRDNKNQDNSRLKQIRQKLEQRTHILRNNTSSNISKQQYQSRKLKRQQQKIVQQQMINKSKSSRIGSKPINLTQSQLNLSSLSKLAYQNFSKFNPKLLYSKQQDDQIYLKQYESPLKVRKQSHQVQIRKQSHHLEIRQKPKMERIQGLDKMRQKINKQSSTDSFIGRLKARQEEVQIQQKNQQTTQMYKYKDRTQRQKRLIDKFLQKNHHK